MLVIFLKVSYTKLKNLFKGVNKLNLLLKNKTTLSSKNYIELVKFHQKENNWKYFLYTAFYSILFVIFIAIQIASKYYFPAILVFICFFGFLVYRFIEPYYKTKKEFQSEKVQKNLVNKDYAFILEKSGFLIGDADLFKKFIKNKIKFKFKGN